jgi:hypothetical protein
MTGSEMVRGTLMSNVTLQDVLKAVRMLPPEEQRKLREYLEHETSETPSAVLRVENTRFPSKTFDLEYSWLREHAGEYAGEWVALDEDRLISHGTDVRQVHAAAQAAGVEYPYLLQIDPADAVPFGGW